MGNSNSSEALDFEYNVTASHYSPARKFQDFLLGEFFEIKHNTSNEVLLMKVRVTSDKTQYQNMIESCFQRASLLHKNLIKFHGYAGRESSGTFSTTTYKLYLYFQTLPKDLARIIKTRKGANQSRSNQKNYFSEVELHRMMTQFVEVMEFLQVNRVSHGDLRPEACFLTDNGTFMVADRRLLYEEELNYEADKGSDKNYLFSPMALEAYVKGEKESHENRFKADVFSAGMTLLECATFRRSANVYEWGGQPAINKESVFARLSEMQNRYSPRIVRVVAEMLKFEEAMRPDFIRIKRWLTGLEPIGIVPSSPFKQSPHKKNDSSPSKIGNKGKSGSGNHNQILKSTIGPKLSGASPMTFTVDTKPSPAYGKVPSKQLMREEAHIDGSPVHSPETTHFGFTRAAMMSNEEDEVVEFETEETPKKPFTPGPASNVESPRQGLSHKIIDVSVLSSPYLGPVNHGSPTRAGSNLPTDRYFFSNSSLLPSDNQAQGHAGDVAVTDIKDSTFGRIDLKGLLQHDNYHTKTDSKYNTSTFGTTAANHNTKASVVSPIRVFAGENPLKATPSTNETFFNPKDPLLAMKSYSSTGYKNDNGSLSNLTASTRNSEINRYPNSPQLESPGKPYALKINSETPTNYSQFKYGSEAHIRSVSHQNNNSSSTPSPYLLSPIPQINSAGLPHREGETHFYHSHHYNPALGSKNKLDTSLGYDHGIDPENWRSLVVDGMTYNSILSVGSEVSPMLGSQNDLLAQIQSKNNLNYQYSMSNADQILKGNNNHHGYKDSKDYRGSRTSIDGLEEENNSPTKLKQQQHYVKSGYSMQGSRNNVMSGFQTPEEKHHTAASGFSSSRTFGYDKPHFNQLKDMEMDERFRQAMERSKETFTMMKTSTWDSSLTNKIH